MGGELLTGNAVPRDPGAQFEYSNLGVGLLGHALAHPGLARRADDDGHTGWYVTFGRLAHRKTCPPLVVLDNTPFSLMDMGFDVFKSDEIEAVEVYVSSASVPGRVQTAVRPQSVAAAGSNVGRARLGRMRRDRTLEP